MPVIGSQLTMVEGTDCSVSILEMADNDGRLAKAGLQEVLKFFCWDCRAGLVS